MVKYTQNSSYFEKIDTERKAYWLGFLYADGCVYEKNEKKKTIIIQLHPDDRNILEEFLKDISSDRRICTNKKGYISICVSSTKMANDLINLGCIPRKSLVLKFPSENIVPNNLINHFIRGYMDGDGCISTYMKLRKERKSPILICEIKFIGTYDMLYEIKKFFDSEKKVLINRHSPNSCQISFAGKKYRDIVDSLYENATIYMKRKKDKWDEYKKYMEYQENKRKEKSDIEIVKLDKYTNHIGTYTLQELKKEYDASAIKKCCKHEKYESHKEFLKKGIDLKANFGYTKNTVNKNTKESKNVRQYDLSGNLINTWDSANAAAEYYNTTAKAIRKVCIGERKTCCNFIWKYTGIIENKKNKAVRQYSLSGELIREWSNLRKAALYYDVTFQAIERAISGKYKTCRGFVWRYGDI
ncbi:NUMOD1 domain-containing DNA-binding protein [Clostridium sp. 'White wine YQ']|uniref:NUMOD1 domain-containing DNA-binding protein n=1 Tax=Clostridium sp. 'White wine YQ' TaxID=3027474 RepID=UPI002366B3AD|nr:NUMOD1 domain-containing DNA-binding protein [Clostridium sp. 'White wine YQ']MDD7794781.1 NUMOD1 domain-containing DNA-binding protein [Clostridium sp. 'White wine YQ']